VVHVQLSHPHLWPIILTSLWLQEALLLLLLLHRKPVLLLNCFLAALHLLFVLLQLMGLALQLLFPLQVLQTSLLWPWLQAWVSLPEYLPQAWLNMRN
jgi:hypothetical protein